MPYRSMKYDILEYEKQIREIQRKNEKSDQYSSAAEHLCRFKKEDRLIPVYTLCLYHGENVWNGPRSLKDMMDFGNDRDKMSSLFFDYPLRLYCINEVTDFSVFHTELKELFTMLHFRQDKESLRKLVTQGNNYQSLSEETMETVAIMLHMPGIWKQKTEYKREENGEVKYNMCKALEDWEAEARSEGMEIGRSERLEYGKCIIIKNMLERNMPPEDICALAECDMALVDKVKAELHLLLP